MSDNPKLNQMTSIIKLFKLKKEHFKQNIYKVNQLLDKKNTSIRTLQQYAASYTEQFDSFILNTVPIIRNNRLFYKHLQEVIQSEKLELEKMEKIRLDLISKYHDYDKKVSGLNTVCDSILQSERVCAEKVEDSANFDLAITRMEIEKKWEN